MSGRIQEKSHQSGKTAGISEEELRIFGLSDVEAKIMLGLLEQGPTRISKLSRVTGLPHTSIHSAIRRLRDQGLVRRVSKGYSSVWRAVRGERVQEKLAKALRPFEGGLSREEFERQTSSKAQENEDFFLVEGIEEILRVYQWFFLNQRGKQVYRVQSIRSLEAMIKKCKPEITAQLSALVAQNHIFTDTLLPAEVKALYRSVLTQSRSSLEGLLGRVSSGHLLSEGFLDVASIDLGIADTAAYLVNWSDETLVLIRNRTMIALLRGLFEFLRFYGDSFDHDTYIREIIEERGGA